MQSHPSAAKDAKAILDYNNRITRSTDESAGRIDSFVKFLGELTANEISLLPKASRDNLENALQLVIKMSRAANHDA